MSVHLLKHLIQTCYKREAVALMEYKQQKIIVAEGRTRVYFEQHVVSLH